MTKKLSPFLLSRDYVLLDQQKMSLLFFGLHVFCLYVWTVTPMEVYCTP
jgi:hypothetical protein